MKTLEKKYKRVRTSLVQSMNIKEITTYLKSISENLSSLIKKDKETIIKENNNGKYENAYDFIPVQNNSNNNNDHILFLALVTFHHKLGGVVECTFPPKEEIISSKKLDSLIDENNEKIKTSELVLEYILNNLVNYCLIDGIHLVNEDSNFFFIHDFSKILYCFSYYIQKKTDNNENNIEDDFQENIRGCIQKSICIVSTLPLFGNIITYENYYSHLSTQMTLYMNQKSLNDKTALTNIYNKLAEEFCNEKKYIFNIRKVFSILKDDLLIILKLIILEKRVIIFSKVPSNVSLMIMTMLSFYPGNYSNGKSSFDDQNGTPFKIFYDKYLIYPLFTLFDLDFLLEKIKNDKEINFLIGTTNKLITSNRKLNYNCLINIDEQKVTYAENINESLKIINGREHKLLNGIYELLNQNKSNDNLGSNTNYKKYKNDEPWILSCDDEKNSNIFSSVRKDILMYYMRIIFDVSYLIFEMKIKYDNDPFEKQFLTLQKNINDNYHKSVSKEYDNYKNISNENEIKNNNEEDTNEETLPQLEEVLADPFPYVLYTILPIYFDNLNSFSNSEKNKTPLEKQRESILIKVNNLAVLSEWSKTRNFKKWYCSYKDQIINYSTLNAKNAHTVLYDMDDNIYKGTMLLGKKNGPGEYDYVKLKMVYNGEFKDDLREGNGKVVSKDGSHYYVGDWLKNKMDGHGIYYSSKLGTYKGRFHENHFEGKGNLVDLENNVYDGMFHKSQKRGKGELKMNNGNIYAGEFKDGKFNGKGILKDSKGNILQEGEFKDGNFVRYKKLSLKDDKSIKDNVSVVSKQSTKSLNISPLNENEEIKLNVIQNNDLIYEDEEEEEREKEKEKEEDKNKDKIIEKEEDKEKEKDKDKEEDKNKDKIIEKEEDKDKEKEKDKEEDKEKDKIIENEKGEKEESQNKTDKNEKEEKKDKIIDEKEKENEICPNETNTKNK